MRQGLTLAIASAWQLLMLCVTVAIVAVVDLAGVVVATDDSCSAIEGTASELVADHRSSLIDSRAHGLDPGTSGTGSTEYASQPARALAPPRASVVVRPNPATRFETVTFDATGSDYPEGILRCNFDFEGDGRYDVSTRSCTAIHTYDKVGKFEATVLVIAQTEERATVSTVVKVQAPKASVANFTVSPVPARPGVTLVLDGLSSFDPDGSITHYEWRLDSNFLGQGQQLRASLSAGSYGVSLEVTDDGVVLTGSALQMYGDVADRQLLQFVAWPIIEWQADLDQDTAETG